MASCETVVRRAIAWAGAAVIFEFLIVYHQAAQTDIVGFIRDGLSMVLADNLNEFDADAVERMIIPRIERRGYETVDGNGASYHYVLFGFALDLPDETASARIVVDEFAEHLDTAPIVHVVKFEDPLLSADLVRWADEISALEMKLRRVLTLVYLHAYQDGDPYELLREESVRPMSKERPKPENMRERRENEFFHLTFSQYIGLNRRPEFKLPDLLELIRNKDVYEGFRGELSRSPVENEDDAVFLAGLRERMDAIEAMRNCCAHSRRPSKKVEENYLNARPLLDQLLDGYLARWEWQEPVEEMPWDREAREAVEKVLERANWDENERTITLFDADDDRIQETVRSREELNNYLTRVASSAFYANAPREDGESLYKCDEYGILEAVLKDYEERLDKFFGDDE
jgi:hypothetical protein